jgi:hypothetical protein
MRTRHLPPEPFRFLDLPAGKLNIPLTRRSNADITVELRNLVYEFVTVEDKGRVRRCTRRRSAAKSSPFIADSTATSIFPLAHVCKDLRKEFLPHFFVSFEVGLQWLDVEYFYHTVCCTISNGTVLSIRAPMSITVYIDEDVCNDAPIPELDPRTLYEREMAAHATGILYVAKVLHLSLDILPLLKLRLLRKDHISFFVLDPKIDWAAVKSKHDSWRTQTDEQVAAAVQDLARFMVFSSESWAQYVDGELDKVLLRPWADWTALQVEMVFKQSYASSVLDSKARRCYLPDFRRAGLRDFYATTGLTFSMSMTS